MIHFHPPAPSAEDVGAGLPAIPRTTPSPLRGEGSGERVTTLARKAQRLHRRTPAPAPAGRFNHSGNTAGWMPGVSFDERVKKHSCTGLLPLKRPANHGLLLAGAPTRMCCRRRAAPGPNAGITSKD